MILKSINNSLFAVNCRIQINVNTAINGILLFSHGSANGYDFYVGNIKWSYNLCVSRVYINRILDGSEFSVNFTKTEFLWQYLNCIWIQKLCPETDFAVLPQKFEEISLVSKKLWIKHFETLLNDSYILVISWYRVFLIGNLDCCKITLFFNTIALLFAVKFF